MGDNIESTGRFANNEGNERLKVRKDEQTEKETSKIGTESPGCTVQLGDF